MHYSFDIYASCVAAAAAAAAKSKRETTRRQIHVSVFPTAIVRMCVRERQFCASSNNPSKRTRALVDFHFLHHNNRKHTTRIDSVQITYGSNCTNICRKTSAHTHTHTRDTEILVFFMRASRAGAGADTRNIDMQMCANTIVCLQFACVMWLGCGCKCVLFICTQTHALTHTHTHMYAILLHSRQMRSRSA